MCTYIKRDTFDFDLSHSTSSVQHFYTHACMRSNALSATLVLRSWGWVSPRSFAGEYVIEFCNTSTRYSRKSECFRRRNNSQWTSPRATRTAMACFTLASIKTKVNITRSWFHLAFDSARTLHYHVLRSSLPRLTSSRSYCIYVMFTRATWSLRNFWCLL